MCGIFAYISTKNDITPEKKEYLIKKAEKISHRGPDSSSYKIYNRLQIINGKKDSNFKPNCSKSK